MKRGKPYYSVRDITKASADKPLSAEKQRYQLTKMWAAFNEMCVGAPTPEHCDWIDDCIAMVDVLVEKHICRDDQGLIPDAIKAMEYAREHTGRFNASGMNAVRAVLEDYSEAIKHVSERTMLASHRRAEQKMIETLKRDGRSKTGQKENK